MKPVLSVSFVGCSQRSSILLLSLLAALVVAVSPSASFGCSVCGCSLSSDWAAQGYSMMPGLQAAVRYEYFEQSDLRSGTQSADRPAFSFPNDQEIQQSTLNRNVWLNLDYVGSPAWGVMVQLPWHDRFHSTVAAGDMAVSTSQASGLGDVRLLGRYQHFGLQDSYGLQFGLKLPTGRIDQNFATGPQAGSLLDRGLQLGTGTTDVLVGASYFTRPRDFLGCFAQVMLDQPLASKDGFRPAASLALNGGVRYLTTGWLTPQVQLNVRWDGRESGVNSDRANSGGTIDLRQPGTDGRPGAPPARVHLRTAAALPAGQRPAA